MMNRKFLISLCKSFEVLGTNLKIKDNRKVMTGIALNAAVPTVPEVYFKPMLYTFILTVILKNEDGG
jgi:hypothetical protein